MAYMIDPRKILFWNKVLTCGIQVVRTLVIFNNGSIGMILSKYAIPSLIVDIKNLMWRHLWMCRMTNCSCIRILCDFIVYFIVCIQLYCTAACFGVINDK